MSTAEPVQTDQEDVKSTIFFSPTRHHGVENWRAGAAQQLGRTRVTKQQVVNGLVDLLMSDEKVGEALLARLKESD